MGTWRDRAAPIIAEVIHRLGRQDMPALRRALREAYPFGERERHPYKAWCREVRRQLGHPLIAPPRDPRQRCLFDEAFDRRVPGAAERLEKPLFIPLKAEFYWQFDAGTKGTEYRPYGPRWNERTCRIGREVVLSLGYGKKHRRRGVVVGFERSAEPTATEAWRKCYGDRKGDAACIQVELLGE